MVLLRINTCQNFDFWEDSRCEHCGKEFFDKRGYNDTNYHQNVIPKLPCPSCGKNSEQSDDFRSWYDHEMNVTLKY